ncbi:hypothetical protein ACL02R_05930 [Streptomyces sp. MS19]|uniref:hypothetical protein n=1 Tax=Streptomyces sp. MS19 TaxID=3385972 RepID=UPI0039A1F078
MVSYWWDLALGEVQPLLMAVKKVELFVMEIDPEDMADTAAIYQQAVGEARTAGDLAEAASNLSGESGSLDHTAIADADQRTTDTDGALAGRGTGMEQVAQLLKLAMETALHHVSQVTWILDGQLWPQWEAAKASYARAREENPEPLLPMIRARHLADFTPAAQEAEEKIDDEIATYRRTLMRLGLELYEQGYDLAGGPLDLWSSVYMAREAAAKVKELLADGKRPDPDELRLWTSVLNALSRDLRDGGGTPRELTDLEAEFVLCFFEKLDSDTLTALGSLGTDHLEPAQADTQREALQGIADGLIMVRKIVDQNDYRGIYLSAEMQDKTDQLLRAFTEPREGPLFDHEPGTDEFKAALEKWNSYGALMNEAELPPSAALSDQLAKAAVDVQERSTGQYAPRDYFLFELSPDTWVENTGGSGLLHAAALNEDAAAKHLRDPDNAGRLLRQQWEDSSGAAAYISQGTRDLSANPEPDSPQDQARRNVLDAADRHREELAGKGDQDKYGHTDHGQLRETLDMLREDHATAR